MLYIYYNILCSTVNFDYLAFALFCEGFFLGVRDFLDFVFFLLLVFVCGIFSSVKLVDGTFAGTFAGFGTTIVDVGNQRSNLLG